MPNPEMKEGKLAVPKERERRVSINPKEFIAEMEGFIREGSPLPRMNPLKLKHMWDKGRGAAAGI